MLALAAGTFSVSAETITGRPSIIDGDTIEISGERIRLHGIDAPESKQTCERDGKTWACGQDATFALAAMIERHWVECVGKDRDRYGRIIAICTRGEPNGVNLNQQMVADGWAMAYREYSMDYVNAENAAAASRRNLWQSEFQPPWEWRREQRAEAPAPNREYGLRTRRDDPTSSFRSHLFPRSPSKPRSCPPSRLSRRRGPASVVR
jgi:endonuclease YncB( thermonuclease family)